MRSDLESAFRSTRYLVSTDGGHLTLLVDRHSPELAALLRSSGAAGAALLTAFNPGGRRQAAFLNRRSQHRLRTELAGLGCAVLEGRNEDPRGRWPMEPTFLALDLPLATARRIAARCGQVAFLWMEADGLPRLVETAAALSPGARPTPRRYCRIPPAP